MQAIETFFLSIITALGKRALSTAEPFVLKEVQGLIQLLEAVYPIPFNSEMTAEGKKMAYQEAMNAFKDTLGAIEEQGGVLAADLPAIITQAGSDQLLGLFGLIK